MSKSILIIDTPSCCVECACYNGDRCYCNLLNETNFAALFTRLENCPALEIGEDKPQLDPITYLKMKGANL